MPRPRVSREMAERVRELSRAGLASRAIARRTGISFSTACMILRGQADSPAPPDDLLPDLAPGERLATPGERCPRCRARLAVAPCRLCTPAAEPEDSRMAHASITTGREDCDRCGPRVLTRANQTQVRCGRCGGFLRPLTAAEIAARKKERGA